MPYPLWGINCKGLFSNISLRIHETYIIYRYTKGKLVETRFSRTWRRCLCKEVSGCCRKTTFKSNIQLTVLFFFPLVIIFARSHSSSKLPFLVYERCFYFSFFHPRNRQSHLSPLAVNKFPKRGVSFLYHWL